MIDKHKKLSKIKKGVYYGWDIFQLYFIFVLTKRDNIFKIPKKIMKLLTGCSAARLAHLVRDQVVGGSNPPIPIFYYLWE